MSWCWKSVLGKEDPSSWTPYSVKDMILLETAHSQGNHPSLVTLSGNYVVDLLKMVQYRADVRQILFLLICSLQNDTYDCRHPPGSDQSVGKRLPARLPRE